jgi:membrane protease YdiL (CAAX protease family)
MIRWGRFAAAYAFLGVISCVVAVVWSHGSPLAYPEPWLVLAPRTAHVYSLALGLAFGALVVMATRLCVGRFAWARRLHAELRPFARGISLTGIAVLALLSAAGEELLFRGLLEPWIGIIGQALLFGIVHQLPGPSRWVWVAWATLIGLLFGTMFALTGSLIGPIAAHALINGLNLLYLKSHDPEPQRRSLGGLLGQRS